MWTVYACADVTGDDVSSDDVTGNDGARDPVTVILGVTLTRVGLSADVKHTAGVEAARVTAHGVLLGQEAGAVQVLGDFRLADKVLKVKVVDTFVSRSALFSTLRV